MTRSSLPFLAILVAFAHGPTSAQVAPTDDAQFRRQQESGRLDAARENARIERERSGYSNSAPGLTTRSVPNADLDRLRTQNRLRDEQSRIERDSDRLRAEQQRQDRDRIFGNPSP
ncbi:MAG: hypothetical protein FJX54_06375 [Alphaproteobacteria bacterium]|nr:hypothetical protein [Alphaproteobacteria bacterium]